MRTFDGYVWMNEFETASISTHFLKYHLGTNIRGRRKTEVFEKYLRSNYVNDNKKKLLEKITILTVFFYSENYIFEA
jgi:hypothetical protein